MVERPIHRLVDGCSRLESDELAEETIVTIHCQEEIVVRLLASPYDLEDLAYGHIYCENRGEISSISVTDNDVHLTGTIRKRPAEDLLTAACGACTTGDIEIPLDLINRTISLDAELGEMMNQMKKNQPRFAATGGVHAAAVFDQSGNILLLREDIGRHNAFDKVVGACIRNKIQPKIVGLSGRLGWELVAKGVRSGVELIIAVGAISSAAEALARASGMTLVGFATNKSPAVIGDLSRIIDKPSSTG